MNKDNEYLEYQQLPDPPALTGLDHQEFEAMLTGGTTLTNRQAALFAAVSTVNMIEARSLDNLSGKVINVAKKFNEWLEKEE